MKILGLDIGDKRIGVAKSDALLITAQGIKTIHKVSNKQAIDEIVELIVEYDIDTVVVGLPLNMDNTMSPQGEKTQKFTDKIIKKLKFTDRIEREIKFEYFDERMSSLSAEKILIEGDVSRKNRKNVIDKLAAVLILQNYLDYIDNKER